MNLTLSEPAADLASRAISEDEAIALAVKDFLGLEKVRIRETKLVHLRQGAKGEPVQLETDAWIVSFEAVPVFHQPPPLDPRTPVREEIITLENTLWMVIVDARSGEILANVAGTTAPPKYR
jgi:hypothetical protein